MRRLVLAVRAMLYYVISIRLARVLPSIYLLIDSQPDLDAHGIALPCLALGGKVSQSEGISRDDNLESMNVCQPS